MQGLRSLFLGAAAGLLAVAGAAGAETIDVSNEKSNDVSVIDVEDLEVIKPVTAVQAPWGVVVGP